MSDPPNDEDGVRRSKRRHSLARRVAVISDDDEDDSSRMNDNIDVGTCVFSFWVSDVSIVTCNFHIV
jgi:hypothetical protein